MDKSGKKSGTCTESQLIDCIADKSYKSFVAYQTDCFISGHNTDENLGRIEVKKLLEIRLFNEKEEVMARRTMIGINNPSGELPMRMDCLKRIILKDFRHWTLTRRVHSKAITEIFALQQQGVASSNFRSEKSMTV